jgi:hypothetical protein
MKKVFPLSFILLALGLMVAFVPIYFCSLIGVSLAADQRLQEGSYLQQILVKGAEYNNAAVFSLQGEHEFSFKGSMYDYKEVKKIGDDYVFSAIADNNEDNLFGLLRNEFEQQPCAGANSRQPLSNLLKNFSFDFELNALTPFKPALFCCFPLAHYNVLSFTSTGFHTRIIAPPDNA